MCQQSKYSNFVGVWPTGLIDFFTKSKTLDFILNWMYKKNFFLDETKMK